MKVSISARISISALALAAIVPSAQGEMSTAPALANVAAASAANDYERLAKMIKLPVPLQIANDGAIKAEASKWKTEKDPDGTELFTSKKTPEARVAALRTKDGLESFTFFTLRKASKGSNVTPEASASALLEKGKLTSFTTCEDRGEKDSLGRVCVTATPKLCQTLKKGETFGLEAMKELDLAEMRSLAIILTLRGSDHQLDNVVRFGNRLGLKSPLQTTKGQIIALSRQLAKEAAPAKSEDKRDPAAAQKEDAMTRTALERSIPVLKQTCEETGFL